MNNKHRKFSYSDVADGRSLRGFRTDFSNYLASDTDFLIASDIMTKYVYGENANENDKEIQLFVQSSVICISNVLCALFYVYVLWYDTNSIISTIAYRLWQWSAGCAAMVYILVNKTIRRKVLILLFGVQTIANSPKPSMTLFSRTMKKLWGKPAQVAVIS